MRSSHYAVIGWMCTAILAARALAGGGGENMLLVVNAGDENSLRIANAYAKMRAIPECNIVYTTQSLNASNSYPYSVGTMGFTQVVLNPVLERLTKLGAAANQIDYIAAIGQPVGVYTGDRWFSTDRVLSFLPTYASNLNADGTLSTAGAMAMSKYSPLYELYSDSSWAPTSAPYVRGTNEAIHSNTIYSAPNSSTASGRFYMGGVVGYTGFQGNTAAQVIANLQRTVNGDGAKPAGTIYFEQNDDVRTSLRYSQWADTQAGLNERGIPWVQEPYTPGGTPLNRSDVRGAVIGLEWPATPNGSTYLPGSWADNLTSNGATFDIRYQSKLSGLLAAGAGASSGTIIEPGGTPYRFPDSDIFNMSADGSTLGEAYYKTVVDPQVLMFVGDMLSQAYADQPKVLIGSGPAQNQTVSGQITLAASATVNTSATTTGVARLELYVDGKLHSTVAAGTGEFTLDTAALSDGRHELRVVAVNNSAAESEGYTLRNVMVNNHGQSASIAGGDRVLTAKQQVAVPVSATLNGATLSRIELRCLGRTLGTLSAVSGAINLDAAKLAYGDNSIVPVAILSDNTEVMGAAITVRRDPTYLPGRTPAAPAERTAGVKMEFFYGKGGTSIAASDFSGTPNQTLLATKLDFKGGSSTQLNYPDPLVMPTTAIDKLAIRASGRFYVDPTLAGEFQFFFYDSNDSVRLTIDGQRIIGYDNQDRPQAMWSDSVFLSSGEHLLEALAANTVDADYPTYFDLSLYFRGPDGITRLVDNSFLYQAVPEPSAVALLGLSNILLLRRRRESH